MDNPTNKWLVTCVLNKGIKEIERRLNYNRQRYEALSNRFPGKKELKVANERDEKLLKAYQTVLLIFAEDRLTLSYFFNEDFISVRFTDLNIPDIGATEKEEKLKLIDAVFPLTIQVS